MVSVAQLAEHRVVASVVEGSVPSLTPKFIFVSAMHHEGR